MSLKTTQIELNAMLEVLYEVIPGVPGDSYYVPDTPAEVNILSVTLNGKEVLSDLDAEQLDMLERECWEQED